MTNQEIQNIGERYERRLNSDIVRVNSANFYFNHFAQSERELKYIEILKNRFTDMDNLKILEIGAGSGTNLLFFKRIGFKWNNLFANELLADRIECIKDNLPLVKIYEGDACQIVEDIDSKFDIVFQSTVFTSILENDFKQDLANKMLRLTKSGGIVLWYDFAFDNPNNNDVKGIKQAEVKELFKSSKNITFHKVTLAPPIGRIVKKLYPFFNIFPFLRTHIIAVIEK